MMLQSRGRKCSCIERRRWKKGDQIGTRRGRIKSDDEGREEGGGEKGREEGGGEKGREKGRERERIERRSFENGSRENSGNDRTQLPVSQIATVV